MGRWSAIAAADRATPTLLTPAEWRVIEALREGGTNAEIAARLGLSLDTVKYHISNMLAKLELGDRRALASWRPEGRRGRLGALFTVPAALWTVARPIAWVGAGTAAVAGVVVGVVAVVALVAVALVVAIGDGDPPLAVAPTRTSTPARTATASASPQPSPTPTSTPSPTPTPPATPTITPAPTPSLTSTATPAPTPPSVPPASTATATSASAPAPTGTAPPLPGPAPSTLPPTPVLDTPSGPFIAITLGGHRDVCALRETGTAVCWDAAHDAQSSELPGRYTAIDAGGGTTCGVTDAGEAVCWGGDESVADAPPGPYTTISTTDGYRCALTEAGELACWGRYSARTRARPPDGVEGHSDELPFGLMPDPPPGRYVAITVGHSSYLDGPHLNRPGNVGGSNV